MSFIITVYPEKWQYALRSGGRRALDSQQIAWCKIRHCACSGTMRSFREEGRNILIQKRKGKKNPCICSPLLHAFALLCFQRMQELGLTYLHLKWVVSVWVFYQNTRETSRVHQTTWEHSYVFFLTLLSSSDSTIILTPKTYCTQDLLWRSLWGYISEPNSRVLK